MRFIGFSEYTHEVLTVDIVDQLRLYKFTVCEHAADEIERLRAEIDRLQIRVDDLLDIIDLG